MSQLNFPTDGLYEGYQYVGDNGVTYIWDGTKWIGHSSALPPGTSALVNNGHILQLASNGNLVTSNFIFPATSGTANQVLVWPGSGNTLVWANQSGTGGGSTGTSWNLTSQGNGCPINVTLTTGTFDIQVPKNHLFFSEDGSWDIGSYFNGTYITGSTSGSTGIALTTDRGTVLFGNSPEQCAPTQSSHFHIMRNDPNTVDLFFGDDYNYIKLPYYSTVTNIAYGVEIGTNDRDGGGSYSWRFGTDGVLTLAGVPSTNFFHDRGTISYTPSGWFPIQTVGTTIHGFPGGVAGAWKFNKTLYEFDFSLLKPGDVLMMDNAYIGYPDPPGTVGYPTAISVSQQDPDNADLWIIGTNQAGPDLPDGTTMWLKFGEESITINDDWNFASSTLYMPDNAKLATSGNEWTFGTDGALTLPSGNTRIGNFNDFDAIIGSTGTGVGVASQGTGGYVALEWIDNPEDATSVAAVVLNSPIASSSGTVQIATGLVTGPTAQNVWEFDADGTLTLPNNTHVTPPLFDPAWNTGGGTIQNNGLTVEAVYPLTQSEPSILTTYAIASGEKVMFSITVDRLANNRGGWNGIGVGIHDTQVTNSYLGSISDNSVGFYESNYYYGPTGDIQSSWAGFSTSGDIVDVAVDRVSNLIWARVNNGVWNAGGGADPVAGTGGLPLPAFGGIDIYPGVTPTNQGGGDPGNKFTINITSAFSVPNGFTFAGTSLPSPSLVFPDGSEQYTAWKGVNIGAVATTSTSGALWYNTVEGRTYVKYNDQWIDASPTVIPPPSTYLEDLSIDGDDLYDANGSVIRVAAEDTPPTRVNGQLWYDTLEGRAYIKYNDQWVDFSPTVIPPPSTYLGDIEIDGSTLYINNATLTVDDSGTLLVNGGQVSGGGGSGWQITSGSYSVSVVDTGVVTMATSRGNIEFGALPEPGGPSHFHIMKASSSTDVDLYFGDDYNYVLQRGNSMSELAGHSNDYGVEIGTRDLSTGTSQQYVWRFETDGVLTLSTASTILGNGTDPNVYIETSTLSTTSTWTFGTNGVLTLPAATPVIRGGGTGTDVTVIATTGSNTSTWTFGADGTTTLASGVEISNSSGFNFVTWNTGSALILADTGSTASSYIYIPSSSDTSSSIGIANTNTTGGIILTQGPGDSQNSLEVNRNGVFISTIVNNFQTGAWQFSSTGTLKFPDNTQQTTAYIASSVVNRTTGSWILATGANRVSITVAPGKNYQMWVSGTCDNGIVEWNATVNVSNTNVPVVGSQYGWYYVDGNALVLTSMPNQVVGTAGVISTATVNTTTSNVFNFGITNNSASTQTVYWGYTTL